MRHVVLDIETTSPLDLRQVGAYRYLEHPNTRLVLFAVKDLETGGPAAVYTEAEVGSCRLLAEADVIVAHNANFERVAWRRFFEPHYGPKRWRCTMARALQLGLPAGLDAVAEALSLPIRKDQRGREALRRWNRGLFDLEDYRVIAEYCQQDVEVTAALVEALGFLPDDEQRVWELDQEINDTGVYLDVPLVRTLRNRLLAAAEVAGAEFAALTGGLRPSQTRKFVELLQARGVKTDSVSADALADMLAEPGLPADLRRALELRQALAFSSTAKLDRMLDMVGEDGRLRGLVQYYGAHTGRWAGRGIQVQNLPRPAYEWAEAAEIVASGDPERTPAAISAMIRGLLVATPGWTMVRGDLAQIEVRVLFALAEEHRALDTLRKGGDLYCDMASHLYGRTITKADKRERQLGKCIILGCGYGMGSTKFRATAAAEPYRIELTAEEAERAVSTYRQRYANVPRFWRRLEDGFRAAAEAEPGYTARVGYLTIRRTPQTVRVRLPVGRWLTYWHPQVLPDGSLSANTKDERLGFRQTHLYGGKLTENVVQAVARDVMVEAMFRARAAGFRLLFTVHDELVCERPPGRTDLTAEALRAIMATTPAWCPIPVDAEAEEGERYGK